MRTPSRHLRRNYLIALIAAMTLIAATSVYSSHGFAERSHDNGHCDLCVHFSGTAGSPAKTTIVGKPVLVVRVASIPPTLILPRERESRANLPRGPPACS